jgi:predicted AlkP superfamily phosphohydrolase/phosphomutase/tetratricopeptide (TPR) repeat protein
MKDQYEATASGSLGLLALGHKGIEAWRKAQGKPIESDFQKPVNPGKRKMLLLGWDAADWKIISPMIDRGEMPALKRLIEKGVIGNIATLDPPLSPMLWTSIGTGKTADKHGILGFAEPDPTTGKIRPASVTSRKVKAVWNILMQEGYKVHTVGWWPSHPAEPLNGVSVSNFFAQGKPKPGSESMLAEHAVHPPELRDILEQYRIEANEITGAHILPFVPNAANIDQEKDNGIQSIASLLAKVSSYHAAATWIMENQEWDFLAVYLNELDVFSHTFMRFAPPKQENVSDEAYENYKQVISSAYRFHDMMLERMMELVGEDTTIVLVSDHGFYSGHQRKISLPDDPAAPAFEHSPYGVLCMSGPEIKKDERVYGSTLLDVTPTILSLFGLPSGADMDGRVLDHAFVTAPQLARIPSWESVEGNSGQHPGELREDPWAAKEALEQLVELGYLEAPGEDEAVNEQKVKRESLFYLARVYLSTNRPAEALPLLVKIVNESPATLRFGLKLVNCYNLLGRVADARGALDQLRASQNEQNANSLNYLDGILLLAEHKPRLALERLQSIEVQQHQGPHLLVQMGYTYIRLRQWENAERTFIHALSIDQENPRAHHGLALASLRLGKYETSIDEALTAVGLLHHFPAAHYHLGEALMLSGNYEHAVRAFSVCLQLRPNMRKAHIWLAKIYDEHLNQPQLAKEHNEFVRSKFRKTIYVVSGLPRTGTSMMMQMLHAGGLDVVTDGKRESDSDNPQGYLEDERVKRLQTDNAWLEEANGKVVKVVAPLVMSIPLQYDYKIIFMERDLHEVLTSQQVMLGRKKEVENKTYPVALADAFSRQLEKTKSWLATQPQISVLTLSYSDVLANPEAIAENINSFLEADLDVNAMASAVNGNLYRNRKQ